MSKSKMAMIVKYVMVLRINYNLGWLFQYELDPGGLFVINRQTIVCVTKIRNFRDLQVITLGACVHNLILFPSHAGSMYMYAVI